VVGAAQGGGLMLLDAARERLVDDARITRRYRWRIVGVELRCGGERIEGRPAAMRAGSRRFGPRTGALTTRTRSEEQRRQRADHQNGYSGAEPAADATGLGSWLERRLLRSAGGRTPRCEARRSGNQLGLFGLLERELVGALA